MTTNVEQHIEERKPRCEVLIDLEDENAQVLTPEDLEKIGNYFVYDEVGQRYQISSICSEFKTIFVFVRVIYKLN